MTEISEFLQNCHYFPSLSLHSNRDFSKTENKPNTDFAS